MRFKLPLLPKEIKQPWSKKKQSKCTVSTDGCVTTESSEVLFGFIFTDLSSGKYIRDMLHFLGLIRGLKL